MNWRIYVAREWFLRFGTFTALWMVTLVVTLPLGFLSVWLAYVANLSAQVGTTWAVFVAVLPSMIVLVICIWQGRVWRRDWLWNRWGIKVG
jgi:hypothetical protein